MRGRKESRKKKRCLRIASEPGYEVSTTTCCPRWTETINVREFCETPLQGNVPE